MPDILKKFDNETTSPIVEILVSAAEAHNVVFVMDHKFDIIYSNGHLENILDLSCHQIIGTNYSDILDKAHSEKEGTSLSDQKEWLSSIRDEIIKQGKWSGEIEYVVQENKSINLETTFVPHIENGHLNEIVCIQTDISKHKRLLNDLIKGNEELSRDLTKKEISLKESEERFRLAIQAIGDGVWDWTIQTGEIYFSERWASMLGYTKDELEQNFFSWQQLIHPDDLGEMLLTWIDYMEGSIKKYEIEYRMRTKEGKYIWVKSKAVCQLDEDGIPYRMAGSHTDIDAQKKAEEELIEYQEHLEHLVADRTRELAQANESLRRLATLDALTGLPNRRTFDNTLVHDWERCLAENIPLTLIMIDVDFFKNYNDSFGHQAGDEILKRVSHALSKILKRPTDFVARYGGEEFCMVLPLTDITGAKKMAEEARLAVESLEIPAANTRVSDYVTISVGVSVCIPNRNDSEINYETLLQAADDALYEAKEKGRNCSHVLSFGIGLDSKDHKGQNVISMIKKFDLKNAIEQSQFRLIFQPQCNVVNQSLFSFETLIRWNHPEIGPIAPRQFIPQANVLGVMPDVDKWVISQTIDLVNAINKNNSTQISFSINLSEQLLKKKDASAYILEQFKEHGAAFDLIEFEVSEHVLLDRFYENKWKSFNDIGIKLVVDHCSIEGIRSGMFKRLPVYAIKIHISEFTDAENNFMSASEYDELKDILCSLGEHNIRVTVQGVENVEQYEKLLHIGCENMQGFYIHHPIPRTDLVSYFNNERDIHISY